MRELPVAKKLAQDEKGNARLYEYSILIGEMMVPSGFSCESYGVKISEYGGESQAAPDLTVSMSRIDELLEQLIQNVVTPCTLRDVVDDWL